MLLHYTPDVRNPLMWHKDVKVFSIESSDLPDSDVYTNRYVHREIDIYVAASGNQKRFFLAETERDADNDVMVWVYRSADGFELRVYND